MLLPKKDELLDRVVQAIKDSGWNVLFLGGSHNHPLRLSVYREDESHHVRIYIWNATHGGGAARPQHEYRIQITGVSSLDPEMSGKTLLLGWWQRGNDAALVGFDFRKHMGLVAHSPSIQVGEEALQRAATTGLATYNRGNGEIAIAFRPELIMEYVRDLDQLHGFGESPQDVEVLDAVVSDPQGINDEVISALPDLRREVVVAVRKKVRDTRFRDKVLSAYKHHCAVCGVQLDLVDAAHIVPVAEQGSVDEVRNGLALCILHHKAYDGALLTVDESYRIVINEAEFNRLAAINRHGGRDDFVGALRSPILVPDAMVDRPHVEYVGRANQIRGWNDLDASLKRVI